MTNLPRLSRLFLFFAAALAAVSTSARAEESSSPWLEVGGRNFVGWTGVRSDASGVATWQLKDEAVFQYPQGPRGWYFVGFRQENDGTADWRGFYGLQLKVLVPKGRTLALKASIGTPTRENRQEFFLQSAMDSSVVGNGQWQTVTLPWTGFDYDKGLRGFLEFIQKLQLTGRFADEKKGEIKLKDVRLVRAATIWLDAPVEGEATAAGKAVTYGVRIGNCTDASQAIILNFEKYGWETMTPSVTPSRFTLAPGEARDCVVSVQLPEDGIPPGGHEKQTLVATAAGLAPARLEFITARDVARPSILLTAEGWAGVRAKVKRYDWAGRQAEDFIKDAKNWRVPEAATPADYAKGSQHHAFVFWVGEFKHLRAAAIAWQLTRDTSYAEKVALFLRRLADEKTGYPATQAAVSEGEPQEGENWQIVAIAYDAIQDASVLSDGDRRAIGKAFRLYMSNVETLLDAGNIGNWNVAADTAALFCSLSLGDLSSARRYLHGPCGFEDFVTKGIMDDGWWWECSTGYNFWVASELTQAALACEPWGIDLLHRQFPANFSRNTIIAPWGLTPPYGVSFEKWGANHKNTRSIKQLWDAVPGVTDYRGVAFGINDGHEDQVGGSRMELAYYAFRDPAYVPLIKMSGQRDLIYGVPVLPETADKPYVKSSCAENLGFALLRSQTEKRQPAGQIEAIFKIGTQGGFHGHFDRCSLDAIMRYGRSFWSPESIWWGYGNFMYKFFVQNSVNANMVVVDQKQQEAVPSKQLLFYSGGMMQVSAQETDARWSDPPYGGMVYDSQSSGGSSADLPAMMRRNKQSFPLVKDRQWGELGPLGDRVLQRRLGLVTDDYIVIADYLKAERPHTFDDLFQMQNFRALTAPGKKFLGHEAQFSSDPRSSAQFITDCDWYEADAPSLGHFEYDFKPGPERKFDQNVPGLLKMDVRTLWPLHQKIMLAQPPENLGGQQWVHYKVSAEGKILAQGESGVWILGAVNIDVPVGGAKELTVEITSDGGKQKTLFLANARFVAADGTEIPVVQSSLGNVQASKPGEDYYGGPIKIAGEPYATAIPAQPLDSQKPVVIHIPVANRNAARFKAVLGGDYPFGDESERRKVLAIRSSGTEARFLTVLEPYEGEPMVKSAVAESADKLRVELADGREQVITITRLDSGEGKVRVQIVESKDGKVLRQESTEVNTQ